MCGIAFLLKFIVGRGIDVFKELGPLSILAGEQSVHAVTAKSFLTAALNTQGDWVIERSSPLEGEIIGSCPVRENLACLVTKDHVLVYHFEESKVVAAWEHGIRGITQLCARCDVVDPSELVCKREKEN